MSRLGFELFNHQVKKTTRGVGTVAGFESCRHYAVAESEHVIAERNLGHEPQVPSRFDWYFAKVLLHLVIRFSGKLLMRVFLVEVAWIIAPIRLDGDG